MGCFFIERLAEVSQLQMAGNSRERQGRPSTSTQDMLLDVASIISIFSEAMPLQAAT
jgi:2-keto-4-pentenoate hydratase/2-oxohepta-3-ene-1,7-dioic acid hydratase in catechol pathway